VAEQFRIAASAARLSKLLRRPSRYAQIGLICALLSNALIIGLDQVGVHYLVSTVAAPLVVTGIGYLLHCAYTFEVPRSFPALIRFFATTAVSSLLAILLMVILCSGFGLSASAAIPIATVLLFGWNYALATWAIAGTVPLRRREAQ
jgi:putative flippase GtrA